MIKVNAVHIQVYLKGIDYPASRAQLIEQASRNYAPEDVMCFLNLITDKIYYFPTEVMREFSTMNKHFAKPCPHLATYRLCQEREGCEKCELAKGEKK
jgi:hypothetical protein